jgi:hypothetical protein
MREAFDPEETLEWSGSLNHIPAGVLHLLHQRMQYYCKMASFICSAASHLQIYSRSFKRDPIAPPTQPVCDMGQFSNPLYKKKAVRIMVGSAKEVSKSRVLKSKYWQALQHGDRVIMGVQLLSTCSLTSFLEIPPGPCSSCRNVRHLPVKWHNSGMCNHAR